MGAAMVRELEITEFRGVRELEEPLKLRSFNVLVGRNNVGKTAILEALYLLAMPYSSYTLSPYGKSPLDHIAQLHGGMASLVYGYAGRARVRYVLGREVIAKIKKGLEEVQARIRDITVEVSRHGTENVVLSGVDVYRGEDYKSFLESLGAGLDRRLLALYIPDDSGAYEVLRSFVMRDEVWSWIEKEGLHSKVVKDIVKPAVYDEFTEAMIKRDELCVRKELGEGKGPLYVSVKSLGEGVKRIMLVYLATEYLDPIILLWDDLEVATHPSLIEPTLQWLASSKRQVIVTTHSIDVLYALLRTYPRDAQVVVMKKSSRDTVAYEALSLEELEDLVEKHIDPRRLAEALEL